MYRKIFEYLKTWKESPYRKPLTLPKFDEFLKRMKINDNLTKI